ncbi:hypothetical protein [Microbulbifer sp. SSSA002]|uniref:hypothetical protein n=1 Tax=Microbulbifer sp. SSSA002 TaxID=3243376 RepID=UPI004039A6AF
MPTFKSPVKIALFIQSCVTSSGDRQVTLVLEKLSSLGKNKNTFIFRGTSHLQVALKQPENKNSTAHLRGRLWAKSTQSGPFLGVFRAGNLGFKTSYRSTVSPVVLTPAISGRTGTVLPIRNLQGCF